MLKTFKERRAALVAALRSGEYGQGTGKLCKNGLYCCMGVACEVAIKDGLPILRKDDDAVIVYDNNCIYMPESVRNYYGFTSLATYNEVCYSNYEVNLAYFNDTKGLTFEQIANIIESEPEGMFDD